MSVQLLPTGQIRLFAAAALILAESVLFVPGADARTFAVETDSVTKLSGNPGADDEASARHAAAWLDRDREDLKRLRWR